MPALSYSWALLFSLAGCSTGPEGNSLDEAGSRESILEFPGVKHLVTTSNILHEVKLSFEMDRDPRSDDDFVLGPLNLPGEEYVAGYEDNPFIREALEAMKPGAKATAPLMKDSGGIHRFSFENAMFIVGGFRYPAERNTELFLFKERPGAFTFEFHGRRITIEGTTPWKPAVLYRANREETALGEKEVSPEKQVSPRGRQKIQSRRTVIRIVGEEVQVGPHRIVLRAGDRSWKVNQYQVTVKPGGTISIDRRGEVRSSS